MVSNEKVRVSKDFKKKVDMVRAWCLTKNHINKNPSCSEITDSIAKRIDPEEIYENDFRE